MEAAMKKGRVRVYEIEHDGDLEDAASTLNEIARTFGGSAGGCVSADFESEESAVLTYEVPEDRFKEFVAAVRSSDLCL